MLGEGKVSWEFNFVDSRPVDVSEDGVKRIAGRELLYGLLGDLAG